MQRAKAMRPRSLANHFAILAALAIAFMLPACSIHHKEEGDKKDVKIDTPFGGMQVKADDKKPADTGLAQYPGSRLKEKSGNDTHSANVDMNFGPFGMKVAAATYLTDDPEDKVLDFYRKEMSKYGKVLECKGGIDDHNDELVCSSTKHTRDEIELGTGNKMRRRIVGVKKNGSQTEFSLVFLQLRNENTKEGEL
jgi:hypothetical protein